ncbi:MAG: hypothetical protein AAFP82_21630, partial [Bacteroidota bacterium]
MRKCLSLSIALCFMIGLFAQNDTYKSTFHVGAGLTGIGLIISLADDIDLADANFDIESEDITAATGRFMGNSSPAI